MQGGIGLRPLRSTSVRSAGSDHRAHTLFFSSVRLRRGGIGLRPLQSTSARRTASAGSDHRAATLLFASVRLRRALTHRGFGVHHVDGTGGQSQHSQEPGHAPGAASGPRPLEFRGHRCTVRPDAASRSPGLLSLHALQAERHHAGQAHHSPVHTLLRGICC